MHTNGNGTNGHHVNGGATRPTIRAIVDRHPPHNIDAERALIGALFVGGRYVFDVVRGRIDAGDFPRPYKLTEASSAWRASEVRAWMDARPRGVA